MAKDTRAIRRWAVGLSAAIGAAEIFYLVVANILLNGSLLPQLLNNDPDRLHVEWSSGWTVIPGHLRVAHLRAQGRTPRHQWRLSLEHAEVRLALAGLVSKTIELYGVKADTVAASLRTLAVDSNPGGSAKPESKSSAAPPPDSPDAAPETPVMTDARPGWTIAIRDVAVERIRALELDGYRLAGEGRVLLTHLSIQPSGTVAMEHVGVELHSAEIMVGPESIAHNLRVDGNARVDPFIADEYPGVAMMQFVSGKIDIAGDVASYGFINRYLSAAPWLQLRGQGSLDGTVELELGHLVAGSRLAVEAESVTVAIDEGPAPGAGQRFRVQGAGTVEVDVGLGDEGQETRVRVALRDIEMRRAELESVFLRGKRFQLTATTPAIDLSVPPPEPAVAMEWRDAEMPDVSALGDYFPAGLPFTLSAGRARLNGRLDYADQAVSASFNLGGETITGTILGQRVVGQLALGLVLREANLNTRRLDFSGTHLRMQAGTPGATNQNPDQEGLVTELRVLKAQLESTVSLDQLRRSAEPPPLNGVLELEGTVANLDFLNNFLAERQGIEVAGNGRLKADLRLVSGDLGSGSRVAVESADLVSRYMDFEAAGSGTVVGELLTVAGKPHARLQVALSDVVMRRDDETRDFLQGQELRLTATSPTLGLRDTSVEPIVVLDVRDAVMPDVAVLNRYLPAQPLFGLSSGRGRLNGRIQYANRVVSGDLGLTGDAITGTVLKNTVVGHLDLDLVVKQANPQTRHLDLSGTRIEMAVDAPKGGKRSGKETLRTTIELSEARFQPARGKARRDRDESAVDGVLKLDGRVSNIQFVNAFLPDQHGLQVSGNGRIAARLRLANSQLGPGSRMEIRSADLASRFLDFEATGVGLLDVAIEGSAGAPSAKIGVLLSQFGLRRLDQTTPYVHGGYFGITTQGKRFDIENGARELDTVIKLSSAEVPDMSIYNAYLPQDAGIAIVSGHGRISTNLRLSGVTGAGDLELRARDVEVRVKDQTVKGTLWLKTRLRDGNLDTMEFDVSGTQLGIENGSLQSEEGVQDQWWWGQIDLEQGRMTWKAPLELDATIQLKLRDSGLLVHLFVQETKGRKWLDDLLTIRDVSGQSGIRLDGDTITVRNMRLAGEDLLVLTNLRLREETMTGGLYARYGVFGVGVELDEGRRDWKILNPRRWYDGFAKSFATGQP